MKVIETNYVAESSAVHITISFQEGQILTFPSFNAIREEGLSDPLSLNLARFWDDVMTRVRKFRDTKLKAYAEAMEFDLEGFREAHCTINKKYDVYTVLFMMKRDEV